MPQERMCDRFEEWTWPIDLSVYDRTPSLSIDEQSELEKIIRNIRNGSAIGMLQSSEILQRILCPVWDVQKYLGRTDDTHYYPLLYEMYHRNTSFWGWSKDDWIDIIEQRSAVIRQQYTQKTFDLFRVSLFGYAYLLCGFDELQRIKPLLWNPIASKIFGQQRLNSAVEVLVGGAQKFGYSTEHIAASATRIMGELLLVMRSPRLQDLTPEVLEKLRWKDRHVSRPD